MAIDVKYIGTQARWPELAVTGKQSVWFPGQEEERSDAEAAQLLATGLFSRSEQPLSGAELAATRSLVSGAGVIATSRAALASDSGGTFGLRTGATYTISDTSLIPAGVVLTAGVSGGGTLAVGGSVTINGGTPSITLTARQVAAVLPTDGSATDLTVKVS